MSAVFAPASVKSKLPPGTSTVQKLLDENAQLIKTAIDCQMTGQFAELAKLQEKLHRNLMYLASMADSGQNIATDLQQFAAEAADPGPRVTNPTVPFRSGPYPNSGVREGGAEAQSGKENVEPPVESPKQPAIPPPSAEQAGSGQFVNPNFPVSADGSQQSSRHTSTPQALYPPQNQRPNASPMPPPTGTYQQQHMMPQPHQQAVPQQLQPTPPQQQQMYYAQQQQMQYGGQMGPGGQMVRPPPQDYQQQQPQQYYNPQMQNAGYYQGMPPQQQPVQQYGPMPNQNFAVSGGSNPPPGNVMYGGGGYVQSGQTVRTQMAPNVYGGQAQMPPNQQMMPPQPQGQQFLHGGQQQQPYGGYPPPQQQMYSMPPSSSRN